MSQHPNARLMSRGGGRMVERMSQTLAREWQYARAWDGEASRADAREAFVDHCN